MLHDGERPHWAAVEALKRFRAERGKVVLLSNAPRPAAAIEQQLTKIGVPADCYDAVVTSGGAAREDIAHRAASGPLAMMHLGPDRDVPLFEGLNVELAGPRTGVDRAVDAGCTTTRSKRPSITAIPSPS